MAETNNQPTLKPLAFTETAGASAFPRAVYRSGELWRYCVALAEAGSTPSAEYMYRQYLTDKDVVVIDDNTLFIERLDPEQLIDWQQRIISEGAKTLSEIDYAEHNRYLAELQAQDIGDDEEEEEEDED